MIAPGAPREGPGLHMGSDTHHPFLTARWVNLILLNYVVPRDLLTPLVPQGTELDDWQGDAFISLVGFQFLETHVKGIAIPGHKDFEEINLRFYVRRRLEDGSVRRAVVFIRDLLKRTMIATVATLLYNEPYVVAPTNCQITGDPRTRGTFKYTWEYQNEKFALEAVTDTPAEHFQDRSHEQFIHERHWGYTRQRDGGTLEYRVDHRPWRVIEPAHHSFTGPATLLYGEVLGRALAGPVFSAYVADGSEVVVSSGVRIA